MLTANAAPVEAREDGGVRTPGYLRFISQVYYLSSDALLRRYGVSLPAQREFSDKRT